MRNQRLARGTFYGCAAILLLVGTVYVTRSTPMPYHLEFIGKNQRELSSEIVALLIFAKDAVGALLLSLGIAVFSLTTQLKIGQRWVRWALLFTLLPIILVFLRITIAVGAHSPWWAPLAGLLFTVIGFNSAAEQTSSDAVKAKNHAETNTLPPI